MKNFALIIVITIAFGGCATTSVQPTQRSNLTAGMVKKEIVNGETTQSEILEIFGAPNIITHNKSGSEVWTYDKVSVDRSGSSSYATIVIAGGSGAKSSVTTRTFTLMLEFDENEVVKESSYRSTAF